MDTLKVKDNMIIYSYRNGLKTSLCSDLAALVYNKPNIWLVFKNEEVLVHRSMIQIESALQSNFTRINRQVIVNMHHVSEFIFKDGSYWIYLKNGSEYKISERREKAIREAFLLHANPDRV
ncbi:LytTR family DNA-binding domain-containing protein [Parabacteroides johnsonii]|uniref:LytTR family DNA-binding domain-containing protein n=1 Tax=Parabacteroides johnsonii TaxID=387661 RepID=UPI00242B1B25|nr:LytTR family DNA-binding domain-containing protein [Parabacteroides johnsonii]MBS6225578.1 LytTR family transcriptional regulator [Parabacteroides johnsonii]